MSAKIDWIEKQAAENLKFRLQICETLAKDANTLLTILITAIGAVVAYAIKSTENNGDSALLAGTIAMGAWLMIIALILVFKCIMTSKLIPIGNEPKKLNLENYNLEEIKVFELENVQNSIIHTAKRNQKTAYWLDKARLATVSSPLVFILIWVFWFYLENGLCAQAL